MTAMPPISISFADYRNLSDLAMLALEERHPVAPLLDFELRRAKIADEVPDGVVALGKLVAYCVDTDPVESRFLVHPRDYVRAGRQVTVLSPVGAALLGLRVGDRMPFLDVAHVRHVVRVIAVANAGEVVDLDAARARSGANGEPPRDPGPSAA